MDFFNPNLLSHENLVKILEERNLKIPKLRQLTKNELIKIYEKYALPLGQRVPKTSQLVSATNNDNSSNQKNSIRTINLKRNFNNISKSKCNSNIDNQNSKTIKLDENETSDKTSLDCNKIIVQKRLNLDENSYGNGDQLKTKRPKITWP